MLTRRNFGFGLTATAFAGVAAQGQNIAAHLGRVATGYGSLISDPAALLDLPKGFSYRILSQLGDKMDDGYGVPDKADGMGCINIGNGKVALIRNHEMRPADLSGLPWGNTTGPDLVFDRTQNGIALPGGTTTIIYNGRTGIVESQFRSLAGTIRNCSGGVTPWGSWLSCEEDVQRAGSPVGQAVGQDHGWVFEVPAAAKGLTAPVPLKDMGRFNHEAATVDPRTGIVYMTEDEKNGLLYRFLPHARGEFSKGGRLQALGMVDAPNGGDSRNWDEQIFVRGRPVATLWIDVDGTHNPDGLMRERLAARGALIFARGEGIHIGNGEVYFSATSGGRAKAGQIFRYRPSRFEGQTSEREKPGKLDLFFESAGRHETEYADNLYVAPNGHIVMCEDQDDKNGPVSNHIKGISPSGMIYDIARLRTQTELAGVCFSPDASTMFVNVYQPTRTLAITGPWASVKKA